VVGDFNGDGRDDVFWYGPEAASDTIHYGTATRGQFSFASATVFGSYTPLAGDFDGDGRDDILWYGPGDAHDAMWFGNSTRSDFTEVAVDVKGLYSPVR
jgi:hypothetical protein